MNRQLKLISEPRESNPSDSGNSGEGHTGPGPAQNRHPQNRGEARRRRESVAQRRGRQAARLAAQRARQSALTREARLLAEHNREVFAELAERRGKSPLPVPVPRKRHHKGDDTTPHAA